VQPRAAHAAEPQQSSQLEADLFDVFSAKPAQPKEASANALDDIFAGGSQPLASSAQPQAPQSKVDVLGQFYTASQNPNPQPNMGGQQMMGGN